MLLILIGLPHGRSFPTRWALELKGDGTLASAAIAWSVLTSVISLAVIVGMF